MKRAKDFTHERLHPYVVGPKIDGEGWFMFLGSMLHYFKAGSDVSVCGLVKDVAHWGAEIFIPKDDLREIIETELPNIVFDRDVCKNCLRSLDKQEKNFHYEEIY